MQARTQKVMENGPMDAKIVVSRIMLEMEGTKDDVGLSVEVTQGFSFEIKKYQNRYYVDSYTLI